MTLLGHVPQTEEVKCLGLHLERSLTWHKHIFTRRKQLGNALAKMYSLLGRESKLSSSNKLLIWAYGIRLWGTTSTSNVEMLEGSAHDNGRTMVHAEYGNTEGSPNPSG
jgi:hypothetical protein